MKTTKLIFCSLLLSGILVSCASSSTTMETKQRQAKTAAEVESVVHAQNYKIEVSQMSPAGIPSRMLSSLYSLEVRNDSVISFLPYAGRAYSAPYGGSSPLNFKAPIQEYKTTYGKKGKADIVFKVKTREDSFTYRVSIYPNGSANINITPTNRQSINFQGNLVLP